MIKNEQFLFIAAPMVRYSKLPFRVLCKKYNVHLRYTPMITSEEFVNSSEARLNEFSTNEGVNYKILRKKPNLKQR